MKLKVQLKQLLLLVAMASCSLVFSPVHASIISFDEAVDGDLSGSFGAASVFDISAAGDHVWNGSAFISDARFAEDIDAFLIAVASGFEIVSFTSVISNVEYGGTLFDEVNADSFLRADNGTYFFRNQIDLLTQQVNVGVDSFPAAEGQYQVRAPSRREFVCYDSNGCSVNWDWSIEIQTRATSVAEPGVVGLFAASLLGMAFRRRRTAA